jgi:3-oxoacyl-[acyl-carrier protein] reductase
MRLAGRFAIITGASQGLGEQIAKHFVSEGASVLVCARSASAVRSVSQQLSAAASSDQKVLARIADVSKRPDVDQLVADALQAFGRIDILVNNAGVYGPLGPTHEIDWDAWLETININLVGLVYACRTVTPAMIHQKSGKIINLSGGGATNPLPRMTSYATSKAAVVRFTESLALDLEPYGIDVNAIAPGALDTRLLDQVLAAGPEIVGREFHDRMIKVKQQGGTPLSVSADLVVYLASAESNGITGRLISAAWDKWSTLHTRAKELHPTDIYTLRRIVPADRGRAWDD